MKKKLLKIILPIAAAAILLLSLLLYFTVPPKPSNFSIFLYARLSDENGASAGENDDAEVCSHQTTEKDFLTCPVNGKISFDMYMNPQDKRSYRTSYKGSRFIDVEIVGSDGAVLYTPDFSQSHSYTLPDIRGKRTQTSVTCYGNYTFTEKGVYSVVARSKFKINGKNYEYSTYPITVTVE